MAHIDTHEHKNEKGIRARADRSRLLRRLSLYSNVRHIVKLHQAIASSRHLCERLCDSGAPDFCQRHLSTNRISDRKRPAEMSSLFLRSSEPKARISKLLIHLVCNVSSVARREELILLNSISLNLVDAALYQHADFVLDL